MHSWDLLSPWFSALEKFSPITGGVPTPATIFPSLQEDHVNNHLSLGVPPPNMDTRTPCQVKVIPRKSEGIEPFTLVNSPPGQVEASSSHTVNSPPCQVEDASSHTVNSPPCQVWVIPPNSGGIDPSTWSTLHQVKSGPCPRTQSTLHRACARSHPQFHLVFQSLFFLVLCFRLWVA